VSIMIIIVALVLGLPFCVGAVALLARLYSLKWYVALARVVVGGVIGVAAGTFIGIVLHLALRTLHGTGVIVHGFVDIIALGVIAAFFALIGAPVGGLVLRWRRCDALVEKLARSRRLLLGLALATVGAALLTFVVSELAARREKTDTRLLAERKAMEARRLAKNGRRHSLVETLHDLEAAALLYDEAATAVGRFRRKWWWTLAWRSAGAELREYRRQAALTRLLQAEALEQAGRREEAHNVLRKVTRSLGTPSREAVIAEERMKEMERQMTGAQAP
jgi:hypothetical protein